jgi:hypothetical protein
VRNFSVYVTVYGCGSFKITRSTDAPISNNSFSASGAFYFNGTFTSETVSSGAWGLYNFYILGCGYLTGGPYAYAATWQHTAASPDSSSSDTRYMPIQAVERADDGQRQGERGDLP